MPEPSPTGPGTIAPGRSRFWAAVAVLPPDWLRLSAVVGLLLLPAAALLTVPEISRVLTRGAYSCSDVARSASKERKLADVVAGDAHASRSRARSALTAACRTRLGPDDNPYEAAVELARRSR